MFLAHVKLRNNNWCAAMVTIHLKILWYQRFSVAGHLSNRATMNPSTPLQKKNFRVGKRSDFSDPFFPQKGRKTPKLGLAVIRVRAKKSRIVSRCYQQLFRYRYFAGIRFAGLSVFRSVSFPPFCIVPPFFS